MDLFTPVVEEHLQHKNFSSVLIPHRKEERDLLEEWADGFVDRDWPVALVLIWHKERALGKAATWLKSAAIDLNK